MIAALRVLIDLAPDLRRAGVESFSIDEDGSLRDVKLRPPDPPDPPAQSDPPREPANALDDPDTYGGEVPKRRPLLWDDEEERQS